MRYKIPVLVAALAAGIAAATGPSWAEPPVPYVEAPPLADPVADAVLARLAAVKTAAIDPLDRPQADAVQAIYAARDGKPFWLTSGGWIEAAAVAADEIRRADAWGLDAKVFRLPDLTQVPASTEAAAAAEPQLSTAVMKYVAHARGHRIDPIELSKWLDQRPKRLDPAVIGAIAGASDPAEALRQQHPQHPQFELLRQAWLKARGVSQGEPALQMALVEVPASGPRLKVGDFHPHIALVRQRLAPTTPAAFPDLFDAPLAEAVRAFQREADIKVTGTITPSLRSALNRKPKPAARVSPADTKRILVNMERWRWLPDRLGTLHVWNNLPEFETRLVKDGRTVHQERIVVGKTETQTPVFSNTMRHVVFHPEWGIPGSIKVSDLLPSLQGGDYDVLARRNMKIVVNGKTVSPSKMNWSRIDIREVPIIQGAGPANPLGQVKFLFPNKHDVYMHDTPSKHLFSERTRAFSHGCIRVRNPRVLAEHVLAEDQGLTPADIARLMAPNAQQNNKIDLRRPIPVHNAYFTVVVAEDGSLKTFADMYGHDKRIAAALDGTPAAVIARNDPAAAHENRVNAGSGRGRQAEGETRSRRRAEAPRQESLWTASARPFQPDFFRRVY